MKEKGIDQVDVESLPQYMRIAQDIAARIASGEFKEKTKISGRTLLSSEYNVSSETVRKAMKLLSDMKVVEVKEKSGIYVLSQDNARRYARSFEVRQERQRLKRRLHTLFESYSSTVKEMSDICSELLDSRDEGFGGQVPGYEVTVSEDSDKIGQNIGSMRFWQCTGATVVAIKRRQNVILSPGPYAEIYGGDVIVFVGEPESRETVEQFLNAGADN